MKKIINDFKNIKTIEELKKRKLSLIDYEVLFIIIKELKENKKSEFISETVKNYLEKFKIKIKNCGVGWIATI